MDCSKKDSVPLEAEIAEAKVREFFRLLLEKLKESGKLQDDCKA